MKVWGVVPISLVEAERNGATLVQRLAEMETSSSSDILDGGTDLSDSNKKKANGHKEEGRHHYMLSGMSKAVEAIGAWYRCSCFIA